MGRRGCLSGERVWWFDHWTRSRLCVSVAGRAVLRSGIMLYAIMGYEHMSEHRRPVSHGSAVDVSDVSATLLLDIQLFVHSHTLTSHI